MDSEDSGVDTAVNFVEEITFREPAMDELLQKAHVRRDQLRKELEALESFIQSYTAITDKKSEVPEQPDMFPSKVSGGFRKQRMVANDAAMEAAERLILRAGRPLTRSQLLRALEEEGHVIVGGDKSKVLGTNLWRSRRFHNLKGAGYWPLSEPIPPRFAHLQTRDSMLLKDQK